MTKSNVKLPKTLNVTVTDAMIEKDIIAVKSKVKTVNTTQNTNMINTTINKAKKNIVANKINNNSVYAVCRDNTGKKDLSIKCYFALKLIVLSFFVTLDTV